MSEIEEGETYNLKIESLGKTGDGIAKFNNKVVIVKDSDCIEGESYDIKITKNLRKYAFGEVV